MRLIEFRTALKTLSLLVAIASAQAGDMPFDLVASPSHIDSPRLSSHRYVTAATWIEHLPGEMPRLRYVSLKDAQLFSPRSLTFRTAEAPGMGVPSDPDISISPVTMRPGLIWVLSSEQSDSIVYRSHLGESETIVSSTGLLELPVLEYDEQGVPYAAWAEIDGGQSRVMAAERRDDRWIIHLLSTGNRPYDVSPQIFRGNDSADLHWFSIDGAGISAQGRSISLGRILDTPLRSVPPVPQNRIPTLYPIDGEDSLGAFWLEPSGLGETYLNIVPGRNGARRLGSAVNPPENPAVSREGEGRLAWFESSESGRYLIVSRQEDPERIPVDRASRQAAISVSENFTHLLWVEQGETDSVLRYWRGE